MSKSGLAVFMFLSALICSTHTVFSQTTEFVYQGQLQNASAPANGSYDFEFLLFDAVSGGSQIGSTLTRSSVAVANGIFSVKLDFDANFPGATRFLEIHVVQTGGGAFISLSPRQPISSTPYSVKSLTADTATSAINATNATNATNAAQLGGIAANQYLQTNGNGSALTNLNASNIATGTLANARLGQLPTANIADNAVTSPKIASGQVVKGVTVGATTLTDNVTFAGSGNITVTPAGNTVTIASTGGGVSGSGTTNTIPLWSAGTTLANSAITQNASGVQLPNNVQLAAGAQGNQLSFGSPNGETGLTIAGSTGRADLRFDGTTIKLVAGGPFAIPPSLNGIAIESASGFVGIGTLQPNSKLEVRTSGPNTAIQAIGGFSGIIAVGDTGIISTGSTSSGVAGETSAVSLSAAGVYGKNTASGGLGVLGRADIGGAVGVYGVSASSTGFGMYAINRAGGRALYVDGPMGLNSLAAGGNVTMCLNGDKVASCSSSLRYKKDVGPYGGGLGFINQLHPIAYKWKSNDMADTGFAAEDVAKIDKRFVSYNANGEVEGVKYDRLTAVLVNALKEQQKQIEALKSLVCRSHRRAAACRPKK